MARIAQDISLGHRPNLGDDVAQVELRAGDEVSVLKVWGDQVLARDAEGRLFNIPRSALEED